MIKSKLFPFSDCTNTDLKSVICLKLVRVERKKKNHKRIISRTRNMNEDITVIFYIYTTPWFNGWWSVLIWARSQIRLEIDLSEVWTGQRLWVSRGKTGNSCLWATPSDPCGHAPEHNQASYRDGATKLAALVSQTQLKINFSHLSATARLKLQARLEMHTCKSSLMLAKCRLFHQARIG